MIGVIELTARTVPPAELTAGQVLMDDDGKPFAVVAFAPYVHDDGSAMVCASVIPSGPFDVRTFSGDHAHMRTNGLASIVAWPSYAHASADAARQMRRRTEIERDTWRQYSAVYHADTARPARIPDMMSDIPIEFPAGTTARIAWMGE